MVWFLYIKWIRSAWLLLWLWHDYIISESHVKWVQGCWLTPSHFCACPSCDFFTTFDRPIKPLPLPVHWQRGQIFARHVKANGACMWSGAFKFCVQPFQKWPTGPFRLSEKTERERLLWHILDSSSTRTLPSHQRCLRFLKLTLTLAINRDCSRDLTSFNVQCYYDRVTRRRIILSSVMLT